MEIIHLQNCTEIEGSPFNVDSIDFIGVFDSGEEDE